MTLRVLAALALSGSIGLVASLESHGQVLGERHAASDTESTRPTIRAQGLPGRGDLAAPRRVEDPAISAGNPTVAPPLPTAGAPLSIDSIDSIADLLGDVEIPPGWPVADPTDRREKSVARKRPTSELRIPIDPSTGQSTATGRLIVKFADETGVRAPRAATPFPVATGNADLGLVETILSKHGAVVRQWIDRSVEELAELTARAAEISGRPQPDLSTILLVEPPPAALLATAIALNDLPVVEWVQIERWVVQAQQEFRGCGYPLAADPTQCELPDPTGPGGFCFSNPDPGCIEDDPVICRYGCLDLGCCIRVSEILPQCADENSPRGWDTLCAAIANLVCARTIYETSGGAGPYDPCIPNPIFEPYRSVLQGSCFEARPQGGCNKPSCCSAVCFIDPMCCSIGWDTQCVLIAQNLSPECTLDPNPLLPENRQSTPDFTASLVEVIEATAFGPRPALRARGLQAYTVGAPVLGWQRYVEVPAPPFSPGLEFLESGFRGWGLDLEQMRELSIAKAIKLGTPGQTILNGEGIRIGVIDFAYDRFHEEFICAAQIPGDPFGTCAKFYDTPRVIAEPGQTQLNLPVAEIGHGTAVLGMLVAGDNGFGITGIASEAQGFFFPLVSQEQAFRLQNAIISMLLEFSPGDVGVLPIALAPDGGVGPNERPTQQPIVTEPAYFTLLRLATDLRILCLVAAGNSCAPVAPEASGEGPQRSGALVVGAANPGAFLIPAPFAGNPPACTVNFGPFARYPYSNWFSFEGEANARVDLFGWGNYVTTTGGLADLFRGSPPSGNPEYRRTYTSQFSGTSAATAMVAGAAAILQGFSKQVYNSSLRPERLGFIMRNNGIPQGPQSSTIVPGAGNACFPDMAGGAAGGEAVVRRVGFSIDGRGRFPQLVPSANDIMTEGGPCQLLAILPEEVEADSGATSGLTISVALAGGILDGDLCQWTATTTTDWIELSIASGVGAPGSNVVVFNLLANEGGPRTGEITITAGSEIVAVPVTQFGCELVGAGPDTFTVGAAGASQLSVGIALSSPVCLWTAVASAEWIELIETAGGGSAPTSVLNFAVQANSLGGPRTGTVAIAAGGELVVIEIAQAACEVGNVPESVTVGPGGAEELEVALTLSGVSCLWQAQSNEEWLEILTPIGAGTPETSILRFNVLPSFEPKPRTGTILLLAGGLSIPIPVNQGVCTLTGVEPTGVGVTSAGGNDLTIAVGLNGDTCEWLAVTVQPWIEIVLNQGTGAVGDNLAIFNVLPNPSTTARAGTIRIIGGGAEFDVAVIQSGCDVTGIEPTGFTISADGAADQVALIGLVGEACTWLAESTDPWIQLLVSEGAGVPDLTTLRFTVEPNDTPLVRSGNIRVVVAGLIFNVPVVQAACEVVGASPADIVLDADGGGDLLVDVAVSGFECVWLATTSASWIEILVNQGSPSLGATQVVFDVTPNPSTVARTGIIRISTGGSTFVEVTVAQGGCEVDGVDPTEFTISPSGASKLEIVVGLTGSACSWVAESTVPWIEVLTSTGTGAPGDDTVLFSVAPNLLPTARTGTIRIVVAGVLFVVTVEQAECELDTIGPDEFSVGRLGAEGLQVELELTGAACPWTAQTAQSWIQLVTSGGNGTPGNDVLIFNVLPNTSADVREGTILVFAAGVVTEIAIEQATCDGLIAVVPTSVTILPTGEVGREVVVTVSEDSCPWEASTAAGWILITSGSGSGDPGQDLLVFSVLPNATGADRDAEIVVRSGETELTVTVSQAAIDSAVVSYEVLTGEETTPPGPGRLSAADGIVVNISSQFRAAGTSVQGISYNSSGWFTDLEVRAVYSEFDPSQPNNGVIGLRVTNVAAASAPGAFRVVYAFNYATNQFVAVGSDLMPTALEIAEFNLTPTLDAAAFLEPGTAVVRIRIVTVRGGVNAFYTVSHDLVRAGRNALLGP
jgi:hypothetical protein